MRPNQFNLQPRSQWSSLLSYVLVTTGAVVGLGNILNFPSLVAKFGGLFVLTYILCELFISIPILLAELLIGRRGKQNPVGSISIIAMEVDASRYWKWIGWLCFIILFLTLAFYTVIASYPIFYFAEMVKDLFHLPQQTHHLVPANQANLMIAPSMLEICFILFLAATIGVIILGINRGLEAISRLIVPTYFIIFIGLAIYACSIGSFSNAVQFLFSSSNASMVTILFAALTYAFYKLNVGMGIMIVYGSYLPYTASLGKTTAVIVLLDAMMSLLAYFTIYPLVLAFPHPALTETLSFDHLLKIFAFVPNGVIIAAFFFFATMIAAWLPTIAIAESAAVTLIERFSMKRLHAAFIIGLGALLLGTLIIFISIPLLSHWTFENLIEDFSTDILTPLSALLIAIFAGWIISRDITFNELFFNPKVYNLWRALIRYIAPVFIVLILIF